MIDDEIGKIGRGPKDCGGNREPYFILALGGGPAVAFRLGVVESK